MYGNKQPGNDKKENKVKGTLDTMFKVVIKSNKYAMTGNMGNRDPNPAIKTKTGQNCQNET